MTRLVYIKAIMRPLSRGITAICALMLLTEPYASARKQGQALIDSLTANLRNYKAEDTTKVNLLNDLAYASSSINADSSIAYGTQSLTLAKRLGWKKGEAWAGNSIALGYISLSNYPRGLAYLFQVLRLQEDLRDQSAIAVVSANIGNVYYVQGESDKALDFYAKALPYARAAGNRKGEIGILAGIGNVYHQKRDYRAAIRYLDSAIAVAESLHDYEKAARNLGNLANEYTMLKDYRMALDGNFRALDIAARYGFKTIHAITLGNIGEMYLAMAKDTAVPSGKQKLKQAILYLDSGVTACKTIGYLAPMSEFSSQLSEAYDLAGDYKSALESHKLYMLLKDSVFSGENKIRIASLETQRALDLKDKQIIIDKLAVAKKRNERVFFGAGFALLLVVVIIVVRNIRLSTAKELSENKLNAFQARMNPHFIFNSLSSIQSLILNNETEQSIDYLSEFSILMRQILDNSGQSKVTLKTEIDMLRSYIELEHLRFDGFNRNITVADNINEELIEVPGMVVQPFVENAILHGLVSKGDAGRLDITFERDDKHIICTVEDNGVGRERSAEMNKKRSKSRQSHGTAIATNRLTLLNDKKRGVINKVVYIDKTKAGVATGTKVIIQLPIL